MKLTFDGLKEAVGLGLSFYESRRPFTIRIFPQKKPGVDMLVFYVELINRTKDRPLFIHAVRVHYGSLIYNNSFILNPHTTIEIVPGSRQEFFLSYKKSDTQFDPVIYTKGERVINVLNPKRPIFENAIGLFMAIAKGNKHDSWIEVDFNAFKERRFCRGKVKKMFELVLSHALQTAPS